MLAWVPMHHAIYNDVHTLVDSYKTNVWDLQTPMYFTMIYNDLHDYPGGLKVPKPVSNDPGFIAPQNSQPFSLGLPGTLLSLLSDLSKHQKFGGHPPENFR